MQFFPNCVKILSSYLSNRSQSVYHDLNISRSCSMPRGVPQGSILDSLLHSISANDLPLNAEHCQIHVIQRQEVYHRAPNLVHFIYSIYANDLPLSVNHCQIHVVQCQEVYQRAPYLIHFYTPYMLNAMKSFSKHPSFDYKL